MCMFLDCGRKLEFKGRTYKLHIKRPKLEADPEPPCYDVTGPNHGTTLSNKNILKDQMSNFRK